MSYIHLLAALLLSILCVLTLAHEYQTCYDTCYVSCVAGARDEYEAAACGSICSSLCSGESMEGSTQFDLYRNSFEPQNFGVTSFRNIFDTSFGSGFL